MKRIITDMNSWASLTLKIQERFEKRKSPIVITIGKAPKTHEQLGYLHSEVLPNLTIALYESGEIKTLSEREAKYVLKLMIGYGQWINFNGGVIFDPDSFSNADTETLTRAIDRATDECFARNIHVKPPKEKYGNR